MGEDNTQPVVTPEVMLEQKRGLPLDSEGKLKTIRIFSFSQPHMMAFHVSTVGPRDTRKSVGMRTAYRATTVTQCCWQGIVLHEQCALHCLVPVLMQLANQC